MMRTPDGHGRIELDKFHTPDAIRIGPENAPVNALGIRRIMFAVDDIDDVVARLLAHGAELVGEVVQYEDTYRLAYVRGPEGIIVALERGARREMFPLPVTAPPSPSRGEKAYCAVRVRSFPSPPMIAGAVGIVARGHGGAFREIGEGARNWHG